MKNRQFIVFALLLACPLLLHGQETSLCGKESCNMGATGRVSQCVIKKSKAKEKAKEQEIRKIYFRHPCSQV